VSLRLFAVAIFAINLIIFITIRPIGGKISNGSKSTDLPKILFANFELIDINSNYQIETIISGSVGKVFSDGRYLIKNVELKYQNSNYIENLKSDLAFYNVKEVEVIGHVVYSRSDNVVIQTEKLSYDIEHRYFYIPGRFLFRQNRRVVEGDTLIIERDRGTINALNIRAKISDNLNRY